MHITNERFHHDDYTTILNYCLWVKRRNEFQFSFSAIILDTIYFNLLYTTKNHYSAIHIVVINNVYLTKPWDWQSFLIINLPWDCHRWRYRLVIPSPWRWFSIWPNRQYLHKVQSVGTIRYLYLVSCFLYYVPFWGIHYLFDSLWRI